MNLEFNFLVHLIDVMVYAAEQKVFLKCMFLIMTKYFETLSSVPCSLLD